MAKTRGFRLASAHTAFLVLLGATLNSSSWPVAQAMAAEPPPEGRLIGTVCDENGKPLEDAAVWLLEVSPHGRIKPSPDVLGKTKTDARGQFHFAISSAWFEKAFSWRPDLGLVAHRAGFRIAGLLLDRASLPPEKGAHLTLHPSGQTSFRLRQPDDRPLAGCRVRVKELLVDHVRGPQAFPGEAEPPVSVTRTPPGVPTKTVSGGHVLRRNTIPVPEELAATLTASTDAEGKITLPDIALADLGGIGVVTPHHGTQEIISIVDPWSQKKQYKPWPEVLTLQPAGKVVGRVTIEGAPELPRLSLYVRSSSPRNLESGIWTAGAAHVTADPEGRFEVPALVAGYVFAQPDLPVDGNLGVDYSARQPNTLKAGETFELNIRLKPTVKVRGLVRERGSGRPLPHVYLVTGVRLLQTDAEGGFSFSALPGPIQWQGIYGRDVPALAVQETYAFKREVPANVREYDMPPLDLPTTGRVSGTVTDEAGQAAAGATVVGVWLAYDYRTGTMQPRVLQATTDSHGSFGLTGVAGHRGISLKARQGSACTEKAVRVTGESLTQPVSLTISPSFAHSAGGRVLDEDGRPMPNTPVEIWWRPGLPAMRACLPEPVAPTPASSGVAIPPEAIAFTLGQFPETRLTFASPLLTDSEGRFQTPRVLDADGEYQAVVRVDGCVPAQTAWQSVAAGRPLHWSGLRVQRRRPLEGQVVDRQGRPVSRAKVVRSDGRSLWGTTTDAAGHFQFEGVVEAPGFLFVEAAGFRFHGQVNDGTKPLRVSLTRTDEPATAKMTSLPRAPSAEERRALAKQLLAFQRTKAVEKDDDGDRYRPLEGLARTDPGLVLEILAKKPFQSEWYDGYVRRAVAKSLLKASMEEARTVVDSSRDPSFRATGYLDLCDALPAGHSRQRREWLAEALHHARAVQKAEHRVLYLGKVAERLLTLGDKEQAAKVFREGLESAQKLPSAELFAESLARFDLPAALDLIKDLKDRYAYDRHHGNIAHKIAATNPAEAERVWGMMRDPWQRDRYAARICYRLAPVDRERARSIAGRVQTGRPRAEVLGAMARALAGSHPAEATALLGQAFDFLAEQAAKAEEDFDNFSGSSSVAAALLPVAEQIDPALVPEFFWRAVSFRIPRLGEVPFEATYPKGWMADAALAYALARYDRQVAGMILEEAAPMLLRTNYAGNHLLGAMAILDPTRAAKFVGDLGGHDYFREKVAYRLLAEGDELWRLVYRELGLWWSDDED